MGASERLYELRAHDRALDVKDGDGERGRKSDWLIGVGRESEERRREIEMERERLYYRSGREKLLPREQDKESSNRARLVGTHRGEFPTEEEHKLRGPPRTRVSERARERNTEHGRAKTRARARGRETIHEGGSERNQERLPGACE